MISTTSETTMGHHRGKLFLGGVVSRAYNRIEEEGVKTLSNSLNFVFGLRMQDKIHDDFDKFEHACFISFINVGAESLSEQGEQSPPKRQNPSPAHTKPHFLIIAHIHPSLFVLTHLDRGRDAKVFRFSLVLYQKNALSQSSLLTFTLPSHIHADELSFSRGRPERRSHRRYHRTSTINRTPIKFKFSLCLQVKILDVRYWQKSLNPSENLTTTRAKVVSYIWHPKMPNRDVGTHLKNLCYAAMIPMLANDSKCCGDTLMFMASCIRGAPQFGNETRIATDIALLNHLISLTPYSIITLGQDRSIGVKTRSSMLVNGLS
ncbi:hypothetical protein LguiB_026511 [Lonicera macranthoides]